MKDGILLLVITIALAMAAQSCGGMGMQLVCKEVDYPVPPVAEQDGTCLLYVENIDVDPPLTPGDVVVVDVDVDTDIVVVVVVPSPTPTPQPTATPIPITSPTPSPSPAPKEKCNNGGSNNKNKDKDFCPGTGPKK